MVGRGVERGRVGMAGLDDLGQAGDGGRIGVGVVVEDASPTWIWSRRKFLAWKFRTPSQPVDRPGAAQRSANEKQSGSDLNSQ